MFTLIYLDGDGEISLVPLPGGDVSLGDERLEFLEHNVCVVILVGNLFFFNISLSGAV